MKPKTASKWIVGVSGIVLSAFFISQIQEESHAEWNKATSLPQEISAEDYNQLSEREKELVDLDWEEFETTTIIKETQDEQRDADTRSRRS